MKTRMNPLARIAVVCAVLVGFNLSVRSQANVAFLVLPEFANCLTNSQSNPTDQNSLALFSGTLGAYSPPGSGLPLVVPTNTEGLQLAGCGFGQMLARSVPFPDFETETIRIAQEKLYPPASANTRELIAGSTNAAFRYKQLLYTNDGTDVLAAFKGIAAWFGETERTNARAGIKILRDALKYSPLDKKLRNALLEAYYDFIVAEAQYVKSDLAEVAKYRLGLVSIPAGDFIINHEIAGYTNILNRYGGILDEYGKLFLDRGGIDVSQVDATAPSGILLGQWIFQQEQPSRNQMAAQFRDAAGNLTTVPLGNATNAMLFAGYKDYVALLGVMRDYALTAAELAKFYGMRGRGATEPGEKDDQTLGFELIEGINRELLLNTSLLNALLPNAVPPVSETDASGVRSALAGVLAGTAELTKVGGFLSSRVNLLGFDPDFLVLLNTAPSGNSDWDSYDALRAWLDYPNTTSSTLGRACNAFNAASNNYDAYRGYADQVFNEMSDNETSYSQRYREICGYLPEELPDPYPPSVPVGRYPPINTNVPPSHFNNPRGGSELRQAHLSIEQSNAKATSLNTNSSLLDNQLTNALNRLNNSYTRSNTILGATKTYQTNITTERNTITKWSAAQAGTQAAYDMMSDVASIGGGISADPVSALMGGAAMGSVYLYGAANIAVQTIGEQKKGNAERDLALAAADFDKELALADSDQNIFQAGEEYRNLERERQSQLLTAQDNGFVRDQEMERIDGLQREMQQVRVARDQNNSDLAGRYYADPIHYLRAQNSMVRADLAFRAAQRWVFLVLRALEYKYNQRFVWSDGTVDSPVWELPSLFKLRNAEELGDLVFAMDQFNLGNLGKLNGRSTNTARISLKDDVWGRAYTNQADRVTEFHREFQLCLKPELGAYVLKLNTLSLAATIESDDLFVGPEYGPSGNLITKGYWLDKIDWIKVKFVDSSAPNPVTKTADLAYGGTCFVRSEKPSCTGGGLQAINELTSFPFRHYSMGTDPTNGVLTAESSAQQAANIDCVFWNKPDKYEIPAGNAATYWKERSVAVTELTLTIATNKVNPNTLQDIHIYFDHRYALRTQCQ